MEANKIEIYDTTLRDGTQGEGVSFSVSDKLRVAKLLDELGVDFIEGGWPGANPRDSEFFARAKREWRPRRARLAAFGSTAHPGSAPERDENLNALLAAETEVVTIFGKSWTLHVRQALGISEEENLRLVEGSVAHLVRAGRDVIFDAEHFFDGYRADADYALAVLRAAESGGARRIVLCDTNGGSLPEHIGAATRSATAAVTTMLGIHTHNDCDLGVANALAAIAAGARHAQGTFNGWGERCGNANLCSLVPVLELKLGMSAIGRERLAGLTRTARLIAELANLPHPHRLPFVGASAFAHKGGVHVSAVRKAPETYEHVPPETVGNGRRVLVSDLAGKANLLAKAAEFGLALDGGAARRLAAEVKDLEHRGYELEAADASLELLLRRRAEALAAGFEPVAFTIQTRYVGAPGAPEAEAHAEAQVTLNVGGETVVATAGERGPVAALDAALRRALAPRFPELGGVGLTDYKVRILEGHRGTQAQVRVLVESSDGSSSWTTVGVSDNILEASWEALTASLRYRLARARA
ncbi:MAG: citramalate synthase [Terriglobales bacterium]